MGLQQLHPNHNGAGAGGNSGDGLSHHQRVHSPRYAGSMTRRGNSFKRSVGNGPEVELQIHSPRSSCDSLGGSPLSDAADSASSPFDPTSERWHHAQNIRLRFAVPLLGKSVFEKPVVGLTFRDRRRLGNFVFLVFCGVCLWLGVMKIFAGGWLGSLLTERAELSLSMSAEYTSRKTGLIYHSGFKGPIDNDRYLMTLSTGVDGVHGKLLKHAEIWAQPNRDNFTQCIEPANFKNVDAKANGYILVNANGDL